MEDDLGFGMGSGHIPIFWLLSVLYMDRKLCEGFSLERHVQGTAVYMNSRSGSQSNLGRTVP